METGKPGLVTFLHLSRGISWSPINAILRNPICLHGGRSIPPRGQKRLSRGRGCRDPYLHVIYIVLSLSPSVQGSLLQRSPQPTPASFSFGQSTRKPKPWQDVGLRPERWRELQSPPPPGCRPRELLREPLVIPIAPTCHPPSKSPNADLPALVMIISVPASWNFFQSSFSCRPTLMFSMV